jgi:PilZ domain
MTNDPLASNMIPDPSPSDKRDAARVQMLGRLQGEVMVFQPMLIREVSLGGALVETRFPLHLNSLHDLRLTLGTRSIVVKGRVVHSQIRDVDQDVVIYWTGIEFVEPSEHVASAIVEFLDSVRTHRSGG